ncbi:MAG: Fur family transcriptional regulator [Brotaphodocola sp.]
MIKRNTIQCSLVLETVNQLKGHVTADEIYDAVVKKYPHISRATVYRNLNRLVKMEKIRKIEVPNGADCFESWCRKHYHIRCEKCGRLFDVDMEYISDLEKKIRDTHGFSFTGHDIIFTGICPQCKD